MRNRLMASTYLGIAMSTVFVVLCVAVVFVVYTEMRNQALREAESKARLLLDRNLATHTYFTHDLKPKLFELTENVKRQDYFEPVWMSSTYAVRQLNKYFRQLNSNNYYYKECAVNARTPANEADNYEKSFLDQLNRDPKLIQKAHIRYYDGAPFFTLLRRGESMEATCLRCHSTPDRAPAQMVSVYGPERSFNRHSGEVVSAVSIRISLAAAYQKVSQVAFNLSGLILSFLFCSFALLFVFTRRVVTMPLERIREKATLISTDDKHLGELIPVPGTRELGEFTEAFNRMSLALKTMRDNLETIVEQRTAELERANRDLSAELERRKAIQEELVKSEEKFRLAMEAAEEGLWEWHVESGEVYYSPGWTSILGYDPEEIIPDYQFWESRLHSDDRQRTLNILQNYLNGFTPSFEAEYRLLAKNGQWKWVLARGRCVEYGPDGAMLRLVGTAIDLTAQRQAQEAIRESAEKLHLIDETVEDVVWLRTPAIDGIVFVSSAYKKVWGRSLKSLYLNPKSFMDAIHPQDKERLAEGPTRHATGRWDYEYRIVLPDGTIRWIQDRGRPLYDENGSVRLMAGVARDITEQKRLEDQLIRSQKMEAIGTLAGGIAHELNNLLQVVLGQSEMLLLRPGVDRKWTESITAIQEAGRSGSDLVRRILMFSRNADTEMRSLQLNDEVCKVRELLERTVPRMIGIDLDLDRDLPVINADVSQLEQILLNLAVNAADAMPDGGKLVFKTRKVSVSGDRSGTRPEANTRDFVELTVSDTGHGIKPDVLDRIFEPFFTTKGPGRGTGLGLSMIFGIVKSHGGHVYCRSEVGIGTTFTLLFPALEGDLSAPVSDTLGVAAAGSGTLLVVDDDDAVRGLVAEMLELAGYTVVTAAGGGEALEIYDRRGEEISLVILDLVMPEMSGRECLKKLLTVDPNAKVLIASGYSDDGPIKEVLEEGAIDFIGKPFDLKQLLLIIDRALA